MSDTKKLSEEKTLPTTEAKKLPKSRGLTQAKVKELIQAAILEHHSNDPEPMTEAKVIELATKIVQDALPAEEPQSPRNFLYNVRWEHPAFGGFPMPQGICWYGFLTFSLTEQEYGAGIPAEEVLSTAKALGADEKGLTIEGISVIPGNFYDVVSSPAPEPAMASDIDAA